MRRWCLYQSRRCLLSQAVYDHREQLRNAGVGLQTGMGPMKKRRDVR